MVFAVAPPPVTELGTDRRLQSLPEGHNRRRPRGADGARNQLLGLAATSRCSPACARTARRTRRSSASTSTPEKASALGVSLAEINRR
jgi:hypothetical protein